MRSDTMPDPVQGEPEPPASDDPIVKYDGRGEPVYLSQLGNRAERRAALREIRRANRRSS